MPANTDIYGFTYPCGELVDAAAFTLLTGQIDTKMSDVDSDWFEMLNRRNDDVQGVPQNIAAGALVVLATPVFTFPAAGVWTVSWEIFVGTTPPTINMFRAIPRHNAAFKFGMTMNTENFVLSPACPSIAMVVAAGDTATVGVVYNGTGTMDVSGRLSAKLLCRIA